MAVGHALLTASENGMTAAEMSFVAQQHQSNLKKVAEELVREGALRYTDPPSVNGRRGRKPRVAFAFADAERQRFEELVADENPMGLLGMGTQLVMVDAEDQPVRLSEVLSQSAAVSAAAWATHVDGERPEVWLAYEGHHAPDDSRDLMAILHAAELNARRGSVGKLASTRDLARAEERKKQGVQEWRTQLQAQRPNPTTRP
ncbi:MAG: hypothetical protein WA687_13245 [Solirubrobacterales bacterium]